jgi:DNA-binding NarL/FixJ family response regulator
MPAATSLRIAIFEDSAVFLERLTDLISEIHGAEIVATASVASAASDLIRDHKPDFVLIDFFLASGTGLDVLTDMRELGTKAKAIVMTSEPSDALEAACRALGATQFLDKATIADSIVDLLSTQLLEI